jgi:serpin B
MKAGQKVTTKRVSASLNVRHLFQTEAAWQKLRQMGFGQAVAPTESIMVSITRRAFISGSVAGVALLLAFTLPHEAVAQDKSDKALTEAYNASGQQLFKKFADSRGNIVFSPYSIGTAMAMALSGARGETATEMTKVLKHRLQGAEIDAANAGVIAILNGYDRSSEQPSCPDTMRWSGQQCESSPAADGRCPFMARRAGERCVADPINRAPSAQLRVANALIQGKQRDLVAKDYVALLADKYAAEVLQGVGVNEVNDWVKRKTEGKIDKIIDQLPDVILLNAIYFKARWESTFSKELTQDKPFSLSRSRKVSAPMMAKTGHFSVVSRQSYRAIRLPYDVNELGMVIVLPNEVDGVARIGDRIDAQELSNLLAVLRATPTKLVALELPRFKAAFEIDNLAALFRQAGMTRAFDRQKADFSGITGQPALNVPFWIDQIRHRAFIEVMEDGTEAAAVTAIAMKASSIPQRLPEPEPFHVDHPFLFYIVDNATGVVLFQGRITEPRQTR